MPAQTPDWLPTLTPRLTAQLEFLMQIDALKSIHRASRIATGERFENSAEHSWHLCMFATVLAEHANTPVDTNRVVSMLLIHDIVEIDAGDLPLHGQPDPDHAKKEIAAAERLFNLLPSDQAATMRALWDEFEENESDDAKFARALDRLQPVILNSLTSGGTWKDFSVSLTQLSTRTQTMKSGSNTLWNIAEKIYADAMNKGWLRAD